jgi:hypothetical protein
MDVHGFSRWNDWNYNQDLKDGGKTNADWEVEPAHIGVDMFIQIVDDVEK